MAPLVDLDVDLLAALELAGAERLVGECEWEVMVSLAAELAAVD